jgi:hypothetical protein
MKKYIFVALLVIISAVPVFAQVSFSGSADLSFDANISESEDYNSLMNPGNALGIQDIGFSSTFISKLDAGDKNTTFSTWFSLKGYPIGQGFSALGMPDDFIQSLGDTIISFDLMRLSANVYLSDKVSMEVGRQSMLTGYGYGWNPIDFANPLKNPLDPDAALRGVDGFSFKFFLSDNTALKLYGILPRELLTAGLEYEEVKAGGEMTVYFPGFELKLAGFYDYDRTEGSDAYTPSIGTGVMVDLFGIGVYGEAAVRQGSRSSFTDGSASSVSRKDQWLFSVLAGLEYTFSTETYAVLEYFYNGEGYNKTERSDFEDSVNAANLAFGAPTSDLFSIYSPGYFARHYIMVNLMQPLYDINTDLNFSAIFSPDSGALTVLPSVSYSFSGNFSGKLAYVGMFDLYSDDFSEVSALPAKHMVSAVFTYSF